MIVVIGKLSSHRGGLISSLIGEKSVTQRWEVSHSFAANIFQLYHTELFISLKKRQQFEVINLM